MLLEKFILTFTPNMLKLLYWSTKHLAFFSNSFAEWFVHQVSKFPWIVKSLPETFIGTITTNSIRKGAKIKSLLLGIRSSYYLDHRIHGKLHDRQPCRLHHTQRLYWEAKPLNFIIITWQDMQLKYNFDNENRKTYLMQHTGVFRIL